MSGACWADPLTRAERRVLREKLARACKRSYVASRFVVGIEAMKALNLISTEMAALHMDVTERAEVATS